MLSKLKSILTAFLAAAATVAALIYSKEKNHRQKAEEKASTLEALNASYSHVMDTQKQINAVAQKTFQQAKKHHKKGSKIILPVFLCFVLVSCSPKIHYVPATAAPELFVFETGIELVFDYDTEKYCISESEALKLQQVLSAYKEQVLIYNKWRKEQVPHSRE